MLSLPLAPIRSRRGFTLIELLIVMVVISILMVMGLFTFNAVERSARVIEGKAQIRAAYIGAVALTSRADDYSTIPGQMAAYDAEGIDVQQVSPGAPQAGSVDMNGLCGDSGNSFDDHVLLPTDAIGVCGTAQSLVIGRILPDGKAHYITIHETGGVDRDNF